MTVNLDRFAEGLTDPQAAAPVAECAKCWREMYAGEPQYNDMYELGGHCEECEDERVEAAEEEDE